MPKPATTNSGKAKVSVTVRLDPELRDWAKAHGINLSELLAVKLVELRSRQSIEPPSTTGNGASPPGPSAAKDVPF